jgi:integrase/recombinase XerD
VIYKENGIYFIEYFDEALQKTRRVSTKSRSKKEAFSYLANFNSKITSRNNSAAPKLSEFEEEYITYMEGKNSASYIRSIKLSFRQFKAAVGDIQLNRYDARIVDKFISTKFTQSPAAALLYFRTLKAAFSKSVVWGHIDENPLKKIKPPRLTKSIPTFISKDELQQILENTKTGMLKELFTTAFYSGMRLGEIVNLVWDCVDFKRKVIVVKNINGFTTKNKKERIIPMNSVLHRLLIDRFNQDKSVKNLEYVFYRTREIKLNENYISKKFKKAVREAGLRESIHFHTLRHSFASNLIQKGASVFVVKELLGHEDIKTTQIYSPLQTENLVDAVSLLD